MNPKVYLKNSSSDNEQSDTTVMIRAKWMLDGCKCIDDLIHKY